MTNQTIIPTAIQKKLDSGIIIRKAFIIKAGFIYRQLNEVSNDEK
jgi:hypothetical protein